MAETATVEAPPVTVTPTAPSTQSVGNLNQPPPVQVTANPVEPTAPPKPEPLDPDYIARGGRWKLGEEELRAIPRDVFERINASADAEVMENMFRLRQGQPDQSPAPQGPPLQTQPIQHAQPDVLPFKPMELKFEDMDDDSPVVSQTKAMNEGMTKNLNDLYAHVSSQFSQIAEALQMLREHNDYGILDRHIGELGDEWKDVFGSGATVDLSPGSKEWTTRQNYRKAILENLGLDAQLGRERDPKEAMLKARYRLFGQKISTIERSKREAAAIEAAKTLPPPTGAMNGRSPTMGLRESVMRAFAK